MVAMVETHLIAFLYNCLLASHCRLSLEPSEQVTQTIGGVMVADYSSREAHVIDHEDRIDEIGRNGAV